MILWKKKELIRKTPHNLRNIAFKKARPRQEFLEKVSTIEIFAIFLSFEKVGE